MDKGAVMKEDNDDNLEFICDSLGETIKDQIEVIHALQMEIERLKTFNISIGMSREEAISKVNAIANNLMYMGDVIVRDKVIPIVNEIYDSIKPKNVVAVFEAKTLTAHPLNSVDIISSEDGKSKCFAKNFNPTDETYIVTIQEQDNE